MSGCPGCGTEVRPHWRACPECGTGLQASACRHCSEAIEPHWKACPHCGGMLSTKAPSGPPPSDLSFSAGQTQLRSPAPTPVAATRIGDGFEIVAELGRGGMGIVYRAKDLALGRHVAIKRLVMGGRPDLEERFLQEARAVASLSHPNIATLFTHGEDAQGRYLVMELLEGPSLDGLISSRGRLGDEEAWALFEQICAGVSFAHSRGVIHRDIKPSNVILSADGVPKLVDFGLARGGGGARLTATGAAMGTFAYMAPEQEADAGSVDERADVYALGCTFYEMITGHRPPVDLAEIPVPWRELIGLSTRRDPARRPVSVQDLLGLRAAAPADLRPDPAFPVLPGLSYLRTNGLGFAEYALGKDPSVELILIPGGEFSMGAEDPDGWQDELPLTEVRLGPYLIGKHPITWAQWRRYCADTGVPEPKTPEWQSRWLPRDDHPVVMISWEDVVGYCRWAGLRLPSEAQWEFAARGSDGRRFPWGDERPDEAWNRANMGEYVESEGTFYGNERDGFMTTAPVTAFELGVGPFGTWQQAGNVYEWCQDWASEALPGGGPHRDPIGPAVGKTKISRGGCWNSSFEYLRTTMRNHHEAHERLDGVGFRPAAAVPAGTRVPGASAPPAGPPPEARGSARSIRGLSFLRVNEQGCEEYALDLDPSIEFILVPGGEFTMGSEDEDAWDSERPLTRVQLSPYLIAKYALTWAQYRGFCRATQTPEPSPPGWKRRWLPKDDHPVVNVSWEDVDAFCEWAGLLLPTEAQWEFAARGPAGRRFPWGSESPDAAFRRANIGRYDEKEDKYYGDDRDGFMTTAPVTAFPLGVGPFGTIQQGGNTYEWCEDWYAPTLPGRGPHRDPSGPSSGTERVNRGGCWDSPARYVRGSYRNRHDPTFRLDGVGFRPAASVDGC